MVCEWNLKKNEVLQMIDDHFIDYFNISKVKFNIIEWVNIFELEKEIFNEYMKLIKSLSLWVFSNLDEIEKYCFKNLTNNDKWILNVDKTDNIIDISYLITSNYGETMFSIVKNIYIYWEDEDPYYIWIWNYTSLKEAKEQCLKDLISI